MILGVGFDLVDVGELQSEVDAKREEWLNRAFGTTAPLLQDNFR